MVASRYGTNEDLKNLCVEAHKRGMHVCLDLVAGHSSVLNPWFQQSALDWRNRYSNWYIWTPAAENVTGSQPYPGKDRRPERYLPTSFLFNRPSITVTRIQKHLGNFRPQIPPASRYARSSRVS